MPVFALYLTSMCRYEATQKDVRFNADLRARIVPATEMDSPRIEERRQVTLWPCDSWLVTMPQFLSCKKIGCYRFKMEGAQNPFLLCCVGCGCSASR